MKIWLDDWRSAPDGYVLCRSVNEVKELIVQLEENDILIELLDLDYDMGNYFNDGGNGIDLLHWLCKRKTFYNVVIHTSDSDCWNEMNDIIEQYWNRPRIKIYLDDVRPVPDGFVLCKSVNEAIKAIEGAERDDVIIELLDLDHDLGDYFPDGGDGIKLLDWLCERETFYPVKLHTANPVGRENMLRLIRRFWPNEK